MSYLEKLSCEQKKTIEQIRTRMKNELPKKMYEDTLIIHNFLKARDFDVDKAELMIRKNLSWKKHFQVDTILKDFTPRPFFEKFAKLSHLGLDKNGNIIKYSPIGTLEARDLMKCAQMNEYMRHLVWHFEENLLYAKKILEQTGRDMIQITLILNMDKLTFVNATGKISIAILVRLLKMLLDNYPESMSSVYIINTPSYYVYAFAVIKALLSKALLQKIHIYAYSGWKEKLLEKIDADVLPAFLGGNRTDPDGNPLCTTFVSHGGRIPEMYHLSDEERDFRNKSLVKRVAIPSKQKKEIPVHVSEAGLRIQWEFFVKSQDIGFGLSYKVSDFESEEVLPVMRYQTADGVEKGFYNSRSSGHYVIVFDNSYSWMNSKEVEYCITLSKS